MIYESELQNRVKTARRHRRIIKRFHHGPGQMIDVGSASGAFLRVMSDDGWTVVGVEPSPSQCRRALQTLDGRGEVHQTMLDEAELPTGVDLVTLWDVLEHVADPNAFLSRCTALLCEGGLLALNVPNITSVIARMLGKKWPLLLAEHLNYFSPTSLRICANEAGLDVIAIGTRPVSFSLDYVSYRLLQHGIPGVGWLRRLLRTVGLGSAAVPVWMGEMYAVCRRRGRP
jgi:SAM-dependent methyltransferase